LGCWTNASDSKNSILLLQLLARADNVKDFIRRGEDEGSVTITLASGEARPLVIHRRIQTNAQSGGISDWKLNGMLLHQI